MEELVKEDIEVNTNDQTVSIRLYCTMEREGSEGGFTFSPVVDEVGQIVLVPDYEWCSFSEVRKVSEPCEEVTSDNANSFNTVIAAHMISDTDNFDWFVNVDEIGNAVITPSDEGTSFISATIGDDLNIADEIPSNESLTEGTWSLPKSLSDVRVLKRVLSSPITTANAQEVKDTLYNVFGDDEIYDYIDDLEDGEDARASIKYYIAKFITDNAGSIPDRVVGEIAKLVNSTLKEGANQCFIGIIHIDDEDGTWVKVDAPTKEEAADYLLQVISDKNPDAKNIRIDVDDVVRILGESFLDEEDDELETPEQEFSSAKTSINSSKLPAIFGMVDFKPDTLNLDYGGGKFDNAVEALAQKGVTSVVYDPYNRTASHNSSVLKQVRNNGGADTITCSNVLNVIKEEEVRMSVLRNMKSLIKPGGDVYITVYEGSGDGVGRETSAGYQLNRKTADYITEISRVFPSAYRKGKLIVARK